MKKKFTKGFTLIELLVVIAVIGILTSLIVVNFNAARARARDARRKADLDQVKKAVLMYYNDVSPSVFPDELNWGEQFQSEDGSMIYMKVLPHDPLYDEETGLPEYNYQVSDSQDFCLSATLENKSDSDIESSQARCSGCGVDADDYVLCVD